MRPMDRVLILMDDLQGAAHLEMTLRKVGFDVEIITNEFHLSEKLLSFNPDYIMVKGSGPRVSTFSVGKKLKESVKFNGKVILVFPQNNKPGPDELIQIRMDLLLFEPVSAIRLVAQLLLMTTSDKEIIADKLQRLAHTDQQFRQAEMQLLGGGTSIENEIQIIVNKIKKTGASSELASTEEIEESDILSFINPDVDKKNETVEVNEISQPASTEKSADHGSLMDELIQAEKELAFKIEAYKKETDKMELDTTVGLSKKATKKAHRELYGSLDQAEKLRLNRVDKEKQEFARALFSDDEEAVTNRHLEKSEIDLEADLAQLEAEFEKTSKQGRDK